MSRSSLQNRFIRQIATHQAGITSSILRTYYRRRLRYMTRNRLHAARRASSSPAYRCIGDSGEVFADNIGNRRGKPVRDTVWLPHLPEAFNRSSLALQAEQITHLPSPQAAAVLFVFMVVLSAANKRNRAMPKPQEIHSALCRRTRSRMIRRPR